MHVALFYLDKYADEVLPLGLERPTLAGWAAWLSKGGERDNPDRDEDDSWSFEPPRDGAEYAASSLTLEEDIVATRSADGETINYSRPISSDIDFIACRFGPGMGWDPESIHDPTCSFGGSIDQQLVENLMLERGEEACLAVGRSSNLTVRYRAGDPPRLEIVEAVTE
jgi:hypothetical protein